ncbi:MATE family efflux transporter [Thalassoroseus pseudoceratinae]|uniref:MATE family efflux transporter n=1 Tax=Thalassoroseus pseudoceratinae TaxID=2713176 RepID=UPI0014223A34|nr:MATE family efflux transporter [Thalassoroseus pseudoceratinae]
MSDEQPVESSLMTGSIRATVFHLALPVLCEQALSFGVSLTDTYLSGRLSKEATAAVGLGAYVGWLASLIFSLVAVGTTALVSRSWGAQDFKTANRVLNRSLAMAVVLGLLFSVFVWLLAPVAATLLQMNGETFTYAVRYLRIDALAFAFTSLTLAGSAALRGSGDMRTPMVVLGLVNVLNMVVSTLLVFGVPVFQGGVISWPADGGIGIDGIIFGTVTARVCGCLLILGILARGRGDFRLSWREWKLRGETTGRILRIGGPAAGDGVIMWGGQFLFLMVVSNLGEGAMDKAAFAAHIICVRVEAMTYLPAVAWGAAAATLVGQSLGAQRPERAIQAGHEATRQCVLLGVFVTASFFFGAEMIYGIMHDDPAVREVGAAPFRMVALFQIPLIISIVYGAALRGAGDTFSPLLFTLICVFVVRVPVAYVFGVLLGGGLWGAWFGMCGDMAVRAILASTWFSLGRWVRTQV